MTWIIPILCREGDDCEICGVVLHDARSELLLSEGRNLVILINNINHQSRLSFQNITPWKQKWFVYTLLKFSNAIFSLTMELRYPFGQTHTVNNQNSTIPYFYLVSSQLD